MNSAMDALLAELCCLIKNLGAAGGLMSPSLYDTAQVLRLFPPQGDMQPALDWLLDQQQPDGGWGDPSVPLARDVPTLAVMLALHERDDRPLARDAVAAGTAFLRRQADQWAGTLPDALPVGVELLLPSLLNDADASEINLPRAAYAGLAATSERRRRLLNQIPRQSGTPVAHSWEAWGVLPDPILLDEAGSIGHSPAATAAWLRAAAGRSDLSEPCEAARRYLQRASAATGLDTPGVVPTVWPINWFEHSFALYMLYIAGLLHVPGLRDAVRPQLEALSRALRPEGLGMSDFFVPDGDDTAAAMAVLHASGFPTHPATLQAFKCNDHFCAYRGELQPSLSVTAHAMHTLSLLGVQCSEAQSYIVNRQLPDGRWVGDKWNGSWLYSTSQALIALVHGSDIVSMEPMRRGIGALLAHQYDDGGWGAARSTAEETAYGVIALNMLRARHSNQDAVQRSFLSACGWLLREYRSPTADQARCWLGKEMYRPVRLSRMIELAATLVAATNQ